jgi:hypothetical protein
MSALPPKADIVQRGGNVRFVPKADMVFITQRMDAGFDEHDTARRICVRQQSSSLFSGLP